MDYISIIIYMSNPRKMFWNESAFIFLYLFSSGYFQRIETGLFSGVCSQLHVSQTVIAVLTFICVCWEHGEAVVIAVLLSDLLGLCPASLAVVPFPVVSSL